MHKKECEYVMPYKAHKHNESTKPQSGVVTQVGDETDEEKAKARKGAKFLGLVVIGYILILVVTGQMDTFIHAFDKVDMGWIVAGCMCMVFYFIFGVIAYVVDVWLDPDSPVGIRDLMSVEASGVFFGNLTPMMVGSVPAQILRLTKTGLTAGEAAATQFTRFVMFQLGEVLFAGVMLWMCLPFFYATYGNIVLLNVVVFAGHALQLAGLFIVCLCPKLVMKLGNWAIKFLSKHKLLKNYAKWYDMVNNQVAEFSDAFRRAMKHLPSMGITLVVTLLQLGSMYAVPWFVLRAFGMNANFIECLAAGSMVQMVASAVPLPGGTGGAEGGFALFFGPLFGWAQTTTAFIIWRVITFFAPTLLAFPLLQLRSSHRYSIYQRWNILRTRLQGKRIAINARIHEKDMYKARYTSTPSHKTQLDDKVITFQKHTKIPDDKTHTKHA